MGSYEWLELGRRRGRLNRNSQVVCFPPVSIVGTLCKWTSILTREKYQLEWLARVRLQGASCADACISSSTTKRMCHIPVDVHMETTRMAQLTMSPCATGHTTTLSVVVQRRGHRVQMRTIKDLYTSSVHMFILYYVDMSPLFLQFCRCPTIVRIIVSFGRQGRDTVSSNMSRTNPDDVPNDHGMTPFLSCIRSCDDLVLYNVVVCMGYDDVANLLKLWGTSSGVRSTVRGFIEKSNCLSGMDLIVCRLKPHFGMDVPRPTEECFATMCGLPPDQMPDKPCVNTFKWKHGIYDNGTRRIECGEGWGIECKQVRIKSISDSILRFSPDYLVLTENGLCALPEFIGYCNVDGRFEVTSNLLSAIPSSIGHMRNVRTLNLSGNRLGSIPDSIGDMRNLSELDLSNNIITSLPDTLSNAQHLCTIRVSLNRLRSLPQTIYDVKHLDDLSIGNNLLESFPTPSEGQSFSSLTVLKAGRNRLTSLPDVFDRIVTIDVSCNRDLQSLPPSVFCGPSSIGLDEPDLLDVESTCVCASGCNIQSLPVHVSGVWDVGFLDLRNNPCLLELPAWVRGIDSSFLRLDSQHIPYDRREW